MNSKQQNEAKVNSTTPYLESNKKTSQFSVTIYQINNPIEDILIFLSIYIVASRIQWSFIWFAFEKDSESKKSEFDEFHHFSLSFLRVCWK